MASTNNWLATQNLPASESTFVIFNAEGIVVEIANRSVITKVQSQVSMHAPNTELWQLSNRLCLLIEAELDEGESIAWIGTPIPRRFGMRSLPIVLFGIPWTAFALFWIASASGFQVPKLQGGADLFPLFGIPFVLIGLGMLSSPFWMMRKAKKTAYVITDARAILFEGGFSTKIRSFTPDRLTDLRRTQRADGSGDLIFERKTSQDSDGGRQTTDHGFLAISDVKAVEDRVRQLVDRHKNHES